uniref:Uncharacterized protein n=1 Tax=viral metagenome TaxID=1070528 RepID=A0A6C0EHD9_9ZZZZ
MDKDYEKIKNIKKNKRYGIEKLIEFCEKYEIPNRKRSIEKIQKNIEKWMIEKEYKENIDNKETLIEICKKYNITLKEKDDIKIIQTTIKTYIKDNSQKNIKKSNNKKNEEELLKKIQNDINTKTGLYDEICSKFKDTHNKTISKVEIKGSCNDSYDLLVIFEDSTQLQCEVKQNSKITLDKWKTPWEGTQLINGFGKHFSIQLYYSKKWYNLYIKSGKIKKVFKLKSEIPTFKEWYSKDAIKFNKNKLTDFTKELKEKIKGNEEHDKKLKEMKNKFVKGLKILDKTLDEFINEINNIIKAKIKVKDCYLCIHKDNVKVWDGKDIKKHPLITKKNITRNKESTDLTYKITNLKGITIKEIRVRWQNTIGIANISVQFS